MTTEAQAPRLAKLRLAADAAHDAADFRRMRDLAAEMRAPGDPAGVAWADFYHGVSCIHLHEGRAATESLQRALVFFRDRDQHVEVARTLMNLASVAIDIDVNATQARALYEEAEPMVRQFCPPRYLAILLGNLGEAYRLETDYGKAIESARQSLEIFASLEDWMHAAWQLANIAHYQILARRYEEAKATMERSDEMLARDPNPLCITWCFDVWIILAAKMNRWDAAARLAGYVERVRADAGLYRHQGMLPWLSEPIEAIGRAISADRRETLESDGASMTLERARALAESIAVG